MRWLHRHAPLAIIAAAATAATALMAAVAHPFFASLAGNLWGIAVLLAVFDLTPSGAQEKQES